VKTQRGITLIELMIAVTLVAAISTGMLFAIRAALTVLQKTNHRVEANRRVVATNQILYRQLAGTIPVSGACGSFFRGDAQSLRLVTSYSIAQGSRGGPQILEIAVVASNLGGLRLIANEMPYFGPSSTLPFCGEFVPPPQANPRSFILADRLASCSVSYKDRIEDSVRTGNWFSGWIKPNLPSAVHFEIVPLDVQPADLPLVSVTIPLYINREVMAPYVDSM
jgi:prepilin-type N-terminal cleavage/methylation domain-containing protein